MRTGRPVVTVTLVYVLAACHGGLDEVVPDLES